MAPGNAYAESDPAIAEDGEDEAVGEPEHKPSPAELLEKFKFYYNIGMYLIFFIVFTIIFYSARPSDTAFYQSETIRDALGTDTVLARVDSRGKVFDYLDKYLVPALWQFEYYNGVKVAQIFRDDARAAPAASAAAASRETDSAHLTLQLWLRIQQQGHA